MTYEEKLSITILGNLANGKMTNQEKQWYLQEVLKEAMHVQREVCAEAVRNELVAYEEYVVRAILNAEVNHD